MTDGKTLAGTFSANLWILRRQTEGLSHEDSLLQPTFRGNCLNWVLGHIIVGRNVALRMLGASPVWGEDEEALYATGSEPLVESGQAVPLHRQIALLQLAQDRLAAALADASSESLAAMVTFRGREQPLAQAIAGLAWHETYHTGQTELLRQLAGTDDKVI